MSSLKLALTADLHWGVRGAGDRATRSLVRFLQNAAHDVLIIAGDIGTQHQFGECLALFSGLQSTKALVPGNHDIWVEYDDARGDSLALYEHHLPKVARDNGFHFLDSVPLILDDLALVGSINWYDYSWSVHRLKETLPDWESRLKSKSFSRGRHNDYNFARWGMDDRAVTSQIVSRLKFNLDQAIQTASRTILITHHPAFHGLSFPKMNPDSPDALLWDAFSGNERVEQLIKEHEDEIPLVFSAHTHYARENRLGSVQGYNIGGDYDFKRLLMLDSSDLSVVAHEFFG